MGLFDGLFGGYSKRELAKIEPIKKQVLALEPEIEAMSDAELRSQTDVLRGRLEDGEPLDAVIVPALAVAREAAWRVLGKKPFPV
jgi:preprotein translocase subunit SecA